MAMWFYGVHSVLLGFFWISMRACFRFCFVLCGKCSCWKAISAYRKKIFWIFREETKRRRMIWFERRSESDSVVQSIWMGSKTLYNYNFFYFGGSNSVDGSMCFVSFVCKSDYRRSNNRIRLLFCERLCDLFCRTVRTRCSNKFVYEGRETVER